MNVRSIGKPKIALSQPAMEALQLLARLDGVTPQEVLERLLIALLEMRQAELVALDLDPAPPPARKAPADVIPLRIRRARRSPPDALSVAGLLERSRKVRDWASALCAQAAEVRRTAKCAAAEAARAHANALIVQERWNALRAA